MNPQSFRKFRFLMPVFALAFVAAVTGIVFYLWNGVLVDVLGVKVVTYWQALGLLVLAKIFFGGFPGRGGGPFGPPWKQRLMMKQWEAATPEQREKMREEMRRRFGNWPTPPWCDRGPGKSGDEAQS